MPGQPAMSLLPGDVVDLGTRRVLPDPQWDDVSWHDLEGYLESYAARRADEVTAVTAAFPEPGADLAERFAEHFPRLDSMSRASWSGSG